MKISDLIFAVVIGTFAVWGFIVFTYMINHSAQEFCNSIMEKQ